MPVGELHQLLRDPGVIGLQEIQVGVWFEGSYNEVFSLDVRLPPKRT